MVRKKVGQVTAEECTEIQILSEHRNGLNELAMILKSDRTNLYEKMVKDLERTNAAFQKWWDEMADKYKWESIKGGKWEIDFDTCKIYLVTE